MPRVPQIYNLANGVTGGVWRDGDVIIKRLRHTAPDASAHWTPSDDPRHWGYWRREAYAYETDLPGRLALLGPRLISSEPTPDGVELQVEAFHGRTGGALTLDDLTELAREMGRSQGRPDQPDDPWLSRGFLRDYSSRELADHRLYDDENLWQQELVGPYVDDELRRALIQLHDNRDRLLAIMEALPRAICHLDLFPANVFATERGLGIIDWSFAGDGALGEDIGNLIPDSIFDREIPASALPDLEERLPVAYLEGLREAGWRGDDRLVMLGVHASAVKYDWLPPRLLARAGDGDEIKQYGSQPTNAHELFAARWQGLRMLTRWATQALTESDRLLR